MSQSQNHSNSNKKNKILKNLGNLRVMEDGSGVSGNMFMLDEKEKEEKEMNVSTPIAGDGGGGGTGDGGTGDGAGDEVDDSEMMIEKKGTNYSLSGDSNEFDIVKAVELLDRAGIIVICVVFVFVFGYVVVWFVICGL